MIYFWHHTLYELLAEFGPWWSALLSGLAVLVDGELHLTPAGETYLAARA